MISAKLKDGDLVSNQPEVPSRWAQYFDEILNDHVVMVIIVVGSVRVRVIGLVAALCQHFAIGAVN